jgi:hypothetical protein
VLGALSDIAQYILQTTTRIARIVDKRILLFDTLESGARSARLNMWHYGADLNKAEARGCQLVEVVAIGVEACGDAYGVAKMYAKHLALKLLAAWCKG